MLAFQTSLCPASTCTRFYAPPHWPPLQHAHRSQSHRLANHERSSLNKSSTPSNSACSRIQDANERWCALTAKSRVASDPNAPARNSFVVHSVHETNGAATSSASVPAPFQHCHGV